MSQPHLATLMQAPLGKRRTVMPEAPLSRPGWDGSAPKPFRIAVAQAVLDDLQERLARVRWPDDTPGEPWKFGTDSSYLKSLCSYWQRDYDWRPHESELNRFRQFKVPLDGIELHYIHEVGEGP